MRMKTKAALLALLGSTALVAAGNAFAQTAPQQEASEAPQGTEETETVGQEIVVRGVRIPDEKRATSEISSFLNEESFVRTGDADIGSALRRVTGLSLSQGKFVIARGLNERYSSITLDGSPLPSPEPLRRVVPLDIIPTSALSSTLVQKTFSPQYSAEFGGGLVELRSKAIPEELYFQIGLSVGFDTVTTGERGLTFDGGSLDFLGFDDGTRRIPDELAPFFAPGGFQVPDQATQDAIDTSLDATRTTVIFEDNLPPNYGVNLAFGGKLDLNNAIRIGGNVAISFGNDFEIREGLRQQGFITSADPAVFFPVTSFNSSFVSTQQIADLNGIGSFGLELGDDHKITSTTLILRSSLKDARQSNTILGDDQAFEILQENLEFFERQVWQTQLRGEHTIPALNDLSVQWRGAFGRAFRDAPFQRQILRGRPLGSDDPFLLLFGAGGSALADGSLGLTFSKIEDENIDAGIDFSAPVGLGPISFDINFGYAYTDKQRDAFVREFVFQAPLEALIDIPEVLGARSDIVFGPGIAGTQALDLVPIFNSITLDNSTADLTVHGAYFGVDLELGRYLRIAAGGRFESSEQTTSSFSTPSPANLANTVLDEDFLLPAATITYNPIGDLQLRVGYSQTITRPQFRELTPALFLDDETDQPIIGNPFLVNTEIQNIDARLEYYFARGQFVTLGGFFKDLTNPIEQTQLAIGSSTAQTYVNAPSAEVYGFELEFEKNFPIGEWLAQAPFSPSTELVVKANYTYTQSSVSDDGFVISSSVSASSPVPATPIQVDASSFVVAGRSLQGQSDHLLNVSIGIENDEKNMKATLLANWASARIRQTNAPAPGSPIIIPEVIERPPFSLDFVFSRTFNSPAGPFDIGFRVRNILGDDYEATQDFPDGTVAPFDVFALGRELSASISKRF